MNVMFKIAVTAELALLSSLPAAAQKSSNEITAIVSTSTAQKKVEAKMKFETATPNLIVSDIERSAAFYRDVLGFQQTTTVPEKAPFVFVWMKQGGVDVFLNVAQPAKSGSAIDHSKPVSGTNTMYVKMHGIAELAARVKSHEITPAIAMHEEFYGMKEFAVQDPDGYLIIFAEEIR